MYLAYMYFWYNWHSVKPMSHMSHMSHICVTDNESTYTVYMLLLCNMYFKQIDDAMHNILSTYGIYILHR